MILEALQQLDLARYFKVVAQLFPKATSLALLCDGAVVDSTDKSAGADKVLLQNLDNHCAGWQQCRTQARYEVQDQTLIVFGFCSHAGHVVAQLVLCLPCSADVRDSGLVDAFLPLVECMRTELKLADELRALAEELTDRYEELNLVYDTQDQASDFEETHTQLTALVNNCRESLNVSFAALVLRDKNFTVYETDALVEDTEVQAALELLGGQMYEWVSASKQVAVVNDVNDKLGAVLCPDLPYRIIAAPVLSGGSESSGVLFIARSYAQPQFTNNDRNLSDVMSRKASKIVQASYDTLTGLMKRSGFEYQVGRAIQAAKVVGASHAILMINIDRMQVINDTLGYEAGDMVISSLAKVIQSNLRAIDTVSRMGGDEFGVLLHECKIDVAQNLGTKIVEAVENLELDWEGHSIESQISLGVASVTSDVVDVTTAIAAAEVACAYVKESGGKGVSVFGAGDEELVRRKSYMDLVGRIQDNLRFDRFELYYQPIAPLCPDDDEVHGEILVRMRGEDGEILSPAIFLPAAERYHLMPAIDRWVFAKTIEQIQASGILAIYPDMLVSINLSGQTLSDVSFVQFVHDILDRGSVPATNLCFEITETAAIADVSHAQDFIAAFREREVRFSLDDFGTGLSSFSYLKELPVDFLKIDGSFVKEICTDEIAATMVSAINQVGHTMGLKTIGEFVENDAIRERLGELGVDYGQGYGIAKPSPFADCLMQWLEQPAARDVG